MNLTGKRIVFLLLVATIVTSGVIATASGKQVSDVQIELRSITRLGADGQLQDQADPQDTCSMPFPGYTGYQVSGWLSGDETYYVYQDPEDSDCIPATPFGITAMEFALCTDIACTTDMIFEIYDAVGDVCPVPGDLIHSTNPFTVAIDGGPVCAGLLLDFQDTICVNGPFFLSYTFVDSVDCFKLFTDQSPGECISYNLTGDTLIDLFDPGFPGQIWMYAIGLDSAQSLCPPPLPDPVYDIPDVYADIASLIGTEIEIFGQYVNPEDSKLVTVFGEYMLRELMPPSSILFLDGVLPDSPYWYGGTMQVTGVISAVTNPTPVYPQDSLLITVTASSYIYILKGYDLPVSPTKSLGDEWDESGRADPDACDPCKFAILVSGGGDAANNKPDFWKDIENLHKHKTKDTASGGGGYCPENVKVIYFEGTSGDSTVIPNAAVESATQANVQAAHDEIADKIAACHRDGKKSTVQKMFSNHGDDDDGVVLLGTERLSPEELKNMQQKLIDSCTAYIYDEFTECYGGDMLNGLKGLDDKGKTEIHGNSAAGESTTAWGAVGGSTYLRTKIDRLEAGDDYETAVDSAKAHYQAYLDSLIRVVDDELAGIQVHIDTLPAGALRDRLEDLKLRLQGIRNRLNASKAEASPSWVRYQFKEYCEWKKIVVPPGGQFRLKFKGSGGCGNVTIYKEKADGTKEKVGTWNWNLPGSSGYSGTNNYRVMNGDGTYWIHNDNGTFTVTVESCVARDSTETAFNPLTFAGFSNGGSDNSAEEFGEIVGPSHYTLDTDQPGFNLQGIPAVIGPYGGVDMYVAGFTPLAYNPWWDDMEIWINVLECIQPGILEVECMTAENPYVQIPINAPGVYVAHLGALEVPGEGQLVFNSISGSPVCFAWDAWGLRSLVPTYPEFVCGDADGSGSINIADVVYLLSYVYGGGPAPVDPSGGDVNCDGKFNVADIVRMICFIFGGCPEPCAECP